jgi:hypothetical protein
MVRTIVRRLPFLALAALLGAVGIGPRRESPPDRREESSSAPAPSAAPSAPSNPAPAASAPSGPRARVGIAPRAAAPSPGFSPSAGSTPGFSPSAGSGTGFSPSAARGSRFAPSASGPSAAGRVRIQRREGVENVPRRHYWHGSGRGRYSHYYDGRVHWYGYPFGGSFLWMRPYGGFWWTWDARFGRWSYWNDGFWWWPGPGGVQYVYINDNYYPYDAVRQGAYAAPAAPGDGSGGWTSPDGRRLVEISRPDSDAILYDKTSDPPAYIRFLGKNAAKVRFSTGTPPTILVEFRNGSFALFDYDGRRLDTAEPAPVKATPPAGETPPPPPDDLPPPRQ